MAERIVSPGVFTNEVDQSFLAGGVAQIGAAVIGPTVKGPALIPTQITSMGDFEKTFGSFTDDSYVPFVVNDYLRNGNVITVTRLLYEDGYNIQNGALAIQAESGSVKVVTHVLHPTQNVLGSGSKVDAAYFEDSVLNNDASGSFEIKISGSFGTYGVPGAPAFLAGNGASISSSINNRDNDYLVKLFGRSPKSLDYPVYVQYENKAALNLFNQTGEITMSLHKYADYKYLKDFSTAATSIITSQKIGSSTKNLFQFHTLSHGDSVNTEIKIGIRDIKLPSEVSDSNGYGTFTVEARRVNTLEIPNSPFKSEDTDRTPERVETYLNVNLDPNSPRYISRVIGDRFQTVTDAGDVVVNGDYPNMSQFIRVSVETGVSDGSNDSGLVPFGFKAPLSPIPNASASFNLDAVTYKTTQTDSSGYSSANYLGFDYTNTHNLNYLAVTPTESSSIASNTDFYLGDVSQDIGAAWPSLAAPYTGSLQDALNGSTFNQDVSPDTRKFMIPFQGGFDGARPNLPKLNGANIASNNTFGFDCSTSTSTGTTSYNKAFTLLSNTDYYDMNLLVTPGIIDSLHSAVTVGARNLVRDRQDTFYVMDTNPVTDSITTVVNQVTTLDNNYVASYWPWVRIVNPSRNVPLFVPPSVVLPGVLAFNDAVQHPWYAPAGLNRGVVPASDTYIRLTQSNRDTLYEARVNPIANFVNDGICIWGQKTLQARPSALDRVNVRRLLIAVKKFIASSTRYLVFEQNTNATRDRFLSIVNPYLADVKAKQGLYAFRAVMDSTNNTPDLIDQNLLYGQLFIQPTRTAEFIVLDFNIQPTGASFPE
jgi:hypothetical protein